ncbi:MAG: tetratricopeptide repeat protein [Chloroflexota bacterium]
MLEISLLGNFQAAINEQPLTRFRSDKVRALLAYLAIENNRAHRRDSLATLLWTDAPTSNGLKNLRGNLYRLKTAIEQGNATLYEQLFDFSNRSVKLDLGSPMPNVWIDAVHFERLFDESESHQHQDIYSCSDCIGRVETAVSLYKGELLPGFNLEDAELFDEWLLLKREQYHQQAQNGLDLLITYYFNQKQVAKVRQYCQRQLELEPWHEKAYRYLMLALAHGGQRTAALAQFEKCQQVLWDELGVEPHKETIAVYEQIKTTEADLGKQTAVLTQLDAPRDNLPARTAPYFGREFERQQLITYLLDENYRLVTLLGEGGVGKTSLSIEVGRELVEHFRDGVWLIQLAGLERRSPDALFDAQLEGEMITAVSQALGLEIAGQMSPKEQLLTYLRQNRLLLIFDNYEHVLAGADLVGDILKRAPQVSMLVTSREPLNFVSEFVYPVQGLEPPSLAEKENLKTFASVQLFADRASRVARNLVLDGNTIEEIAKIVTLVDGNPLAIELAAASLRKRPLSTLFNEINASIDTLASRQRDVPQRHRSMRGVFVDSWQMLSDHEQTVLAKLAVFRGGSAQEAAQKVTGASALDLELLAEKSLVQVAFQENGQTRFRLHELLRQFALEQLGDGLEETTARHSETYLAFLADRADALLGENPQIPAAEITQDFENVRKGWQTAVSTQNLKTILPAIYPLSTFFQLRGRYQEQVAMFSSAIDSFEQLEEIADGKSTVLARLFAEKARGLIRLGEFVDVEESLKKGFELAPCSNEPAIVARLHLFNGEVLWRRGKYSEAIIELEGALEMAVEHESFELQGYSNFNLGIVKDILEDPSQATSYFEHALSASKETHNRRLEAYSYNSLGNVAFALLDFSAAKKCYQNALELNEFINDLQGKSLIYNNLSLIAGEERNFDSARNYLNLSLNIAKRSGNKGVEALVFNNLGWIALLEEKFEEARPLLEISRRIYKKMGDQRGINIVDSRLAEIASKLER